MDMQWDSSTNLPIPAHPYRRPAGASRRWKQRLGEAKATWTLVSIEELIATDGHLLLLAGLIQERYGMTHEAAEREARVFLGLSPDAGREAVGRTRA